MAIPHGAPGAAAAPAAAETQTFRGQDSFSVFVPCANGGSGESVDGILKVNAVFGETFDSAGDAPNFHGTIRFQGTQNANGVITMDKTFFSETCN